MADKPNDRLIQISTAFQRYGEAEPYARTVVCLGETDDVEGVDITWHAEEHRVIETWAELLREHKADVAVGYNTFQFDWRYIAGRCGVLVDDDTGDPLVNCELLGRMVENGGGAREFELNSGAYGDNKFFVMDTPGVQQIDLLQFIRRNHSLASYRCARVGVFFFWAGRYTTPMIVGIIAAVIAGFLFYNLGTYMGLRCKVEDKEDDTTLLKMCRENAPLIKGLAYVSMFLVVVLGTYTSSKRR